VIVDDDPFRFVEDAPLFVVPRTLDALRAFRAAPRLAALHADERARLGPAIDAVADRLIAAIAARPTKFWVLKQFQPVLEAVRHDDTEARDHVGTELEELMEMLGIESSDGVLAYYLGGI